MLRSRFLHKITAYCFGLLAIVQGALAAELVMSNSNYPPYIYNDDSDQVGAVDLIIERVVHDAGHSLKKRDIPFLRSLNMMKDGSLDLKQMIFMKPERAEYINYVSVPIVFESIVLFKNKHRQDVPTEFPIADLDSYLVGVIRGKSYGDYWDQMLLQRVTIDIEKQALRMLESGRIDYLIGDYAQTFYQAKEEQLVDMLAVVTNAGHSTPDYIGVSRHTPNHQRIVADLTRALVTFKQTDEFHAILKAYNLPPATFADTYADTYAETPSGSPSP